MKATIENNRTVIAHGLTRLSAKELAETDTNYLSGSSLFIFDKYISIWNK
jgi:hypothetical protein